MRFSSPTVGEGPCPVAVPSVIGSTAAEATATLSAAGFTVAQTTGQTDDPNLHDRVIAQAPGGRQSPGTTITITIGVYVEPPPDDGGG